MRPVDVDFIRAIAQRRAGLAMEGDRLYFVESRLTPIARREGAATVRALVDTMRAAPEERLEIAVTEALAAGDSQFFRDRTVFARLRDWLEQGAADQPLRVLCVGCGAGQEAYSIALTADRDEVEVVGLDLCSDLIEKARSGLYTQFEVQRGLPIRSLLAHFEKQDEAWRVSPRLRQRVRFERANLVEGLIDVGRFDLVLCRYVLPALTEGARHVAVQALSARLAPAGQLVLSPGETAEIPGLHIVDEAMGWHAAGRSAKTGAAAAA